jgi:SnoaL-like domain
MVRVWLAVGIGGLAVLLSGVAVSMAGAQGNADPAAVITAYEAARNRHDIDDAISYFADDATVTQRATTFSGKDEIRKFVDGLSTRSRFVVVGDRHSNGNRVTWTERTGAQGPGQLTQAQGLNGAVNGTAFQVTVEAVVQEGKIRSLTYLAPSIPTRVDASLDGRTPVPAAAALGAVLAVLVGLLLIASTGLPRSPSAASTLHGRLMRDLRGWTAARQ